MLKLMQKHLLKLERVSSALLKYSVASLLIFVPLYPKFPFLAIPGTQVAIRLEDFLLLIIFSLWFFANARNLGKLVRDDISRSIMIFWVVGLVSLLSAIFVTQNVDTKIGLLHWLRRIEYMGVFFIGYSSIKNRKDITFYIKIIFVVIIFSFIYGLGQKYFNWPIITTQNPEYSKGIALRYVPGAHIVATFAGHYDLASFLVFVLPVVISIALSGKENLERFFGHKNKIIMYAMPTMVFFAGLWLLVNAASRISIASYLGSAILSLLLIRRAKFIPVVIVVSIMFTGFSSNLIDRYIRVLEVSTKKLLMEVSKPVHAAGEVLPTRREAPSPTPQPIPLFEDRSTSIRLNVEWPRAIRALTKNPLLGTGYSSITLATDNDYLRMLGEIGILGFLSFFLVLIRIVLHLFKMLQSEKLGIEHVIVLGILGSIPGVLLNMVFIDILEASKFAILFWLMLGLSIKTVDIVKND